MQVKDIFRENMLLEVYDRESKIFYKSVIREINASDLVVGVPMIEGKQLLLQAGDSYYFRIFLKDVIYYFRSKIQGRKKSGEATLYLISWPSRLERRQRRRYYRFVHMLDARCCILNQKKKFTRNIVPLFKQIETPEPFSAVVINLSGGGLAFVTEKKLPPGVLLCLCFFLPDNPGKENKILVKGRVVRTEPFNRGKARIYRYGVNFLEMSQKTRDKIIKFIFVMSQQRLR